MRMLTILGLLVLHTGWLPAATAAAVQRPHVEVELVNETKSIRPGLPFWLAVRLKTEAHWHTYWINPGDSGLKTTIQWSLPEGFAAGPIEWPRPSRIRVPPLVNYGYDDEVLLMSRIEPPTHLRAGSRLPFQATVSWLVCKEVCIPGKATVELEMPVADTDPAFNPDWAADFTETRTLIPTAGGISAHPIAAKLLESKIQFEIAEPWVSPPEFFPITEQVIENAVDPIVTQTSSGGWQFTIDRDHAVKVSELPAHLLGLIVDTQSGKSFEVDVRLPVPGASAGDRPSIESLGWMLLLALLGGALLNLMPCVFPVISIKILGFVHHSEQSSTKTRRHGLVFSLGILLSFWVLAAALFALRAAGNRLGWGFQLQSPSFIAGLVVLFFAMGLNLLGFFEVGTRWMAIGSTVGPRSGLGASFLSGVLATVVSTPCSAPFMGVALGFAFSQPATIGFSIFTALALGMILPYLILSYSPVLLALLPRPGRWMESFKQFLGFPLLGTVVWLLWVFGVQTSMSGVVVLIAALLTMAFGIWIWNRSLGQSLGRGISVLALITALGIAAVAPTLTEKQAVQNTSAVASDPATLWEPFSPQRIAEIRRSGRAVFVDFGASWCVSCQVNERLVLASERVLAEMRQANIALMKADWTNRDPVISQALSDLKRGGVPVYVFYPARPSADPILLPEVLTPDIVITQIRRIAHEQ